MNGAVAAGAREHDSAGNDAKNWRAFTSATTDKAFWQAWLAVVCGQIEGATTGVVLMRTVVDAEAFAPMALWPDVVRDLSFLGSVAEQAISEGRGVVKPAVQGAERRMHLAYPVQIDQRVVAVVVLELLEGKTPSQQAMRQIHWGAAWLREGIYRRESAEMSAKLQRIGSVMEVCATALREGRLKQTLFDLANQIGRHVQAARVVIGLMEPFSPHGADGATLRVAAMSNAAWFENRAGIVQCHVRAMEAACDGLLPIHYQAAPATGDAVGLEAGSAHNRLATESGALSILTVPLQLGARCFGAITLERTEGQPFDAGDVLWMETLAELLPGLIQPRRLGERSYLVHLRDDARLLASRLFGPKHLVWKFSSAAVVLAVAAMALVEIDYRVTAKTVIEGEVQRVVAAPFESFIKASLVRPGDVVKKGQVLCELDDRELLLEQHKWASEREQHRGKLREAMANRDLSTIQVLSAQIRQSEAQLHLVEQRLERSEVTAPFDGMVISGDLSQLIGSPVELGKKLYEVAPLQTYRVILQVDEREVREVKPGQEGQLVMPGIVGEPIRLVVRQVTPVATAQDGRNFFRTEAALPESPQHLRPGMEGIGKISVGPRRLWWVLTHSLTDWLRVWLWTWLP